MMAIYYLYSFLQRETGEVDHVRDYLREMILKKSRKGCSQFLVWAYCWSAVHNYAVRSDMLVGLSNATIQAFRDAEGDRSNDESS